MAFPSTTNVSGANPGPNDAVLPDTVQMPTGNIWKIGRFSIAITPTSVAATTAPVQTYAATGIGLLTTDAILVSAPSTTAGVAPAQAYVSAADTLAIQWVNPTAGSLTPPAGNYLITVFRVQPNWAAPASGNQLDW